MIHARGHAMPLKVCDENERKIDKKRRSCKNIFDDRKDFVWLLQMTDVNELQVNNSSHTNGTICLVNG